MSFPNGSWMMLQMLGEEVQAAISVLIFLFDSYVACYCHYRCVTSFLLTVHLKFLLNEWVGETLGRYA